MTRIVAGRAGGRRLKVPPSSTRPTSDRVRESLFSSLESQLGFAGISVLDLYAGSGALGLEAVSRGASRVVLVDNAAAAVRVMGANVATVGLPGVSVVRSSTEVFLAGRAEQFDLVLLDPPYDLGAAAVDDVLDGLTRGWLSEGAVVVVERGADGADLHWPDGFGQHWNRRFGGTHLLRAVWYGHDQDR